MEERKVNPARESNDFHVMFIKFPYRLNMYNIEIILKEN